MVAVVIVVVIMSVLLVLTIIFCAIPLCIAQPMRSRQRRGGDMIDVYHYAAAVNRCMHDGGATGDSSTVLLLQSFLPSAAIQERALLL